MVSKLSLKLFPAVITPGVMLGLCANEQRLGWAGGGGGGAAAGLEVTCGTKTTSITEREASTRPRSRPCL